MSVSSTIYQNRQRKEEKIIKETFEEVIAEVKEKIGERPEMPADLPCGEWSDQAIKVLKERYLDRNADGEITETPDELMWRVAFTIASAEARFGATKEEVAQTTREFYALLCSRKFLPNSPTLMNAGKNNGLQYSGCFVLPVPDSLEGIFDAIKFQALIHQSGGGTGFSFSRLRQRGAKVKRSRGWPAGR